MMTFRALLAAASGLSLAACSTLATTPAPDRQAPMRSAALEPVNHEGQGADWRILADAELTQRLNRPQREGRAKNVILFIVDGLNLPTITAARILEGQLRGETGEENYLPFETWGHSALIKTYNENAQVPDSAGTATAMLAGVKTHIGAISVYARQTVESCGPDADVPMTTLEAAEARGLSTGLVSTARITHATPAAAYAHAPSRDWEVDAVVPAEAAAAGCTDIASQLLATLDGRHGDGPEVVLGGGYGAFLTADQGGQRQDGRDLTAEWVQAGGAYVNDAAGLRALPVNGPRALGLFSRSHMDYDHDRVDAEQPSIEEMTRFAIERLSTNENGYFLLVEGGRVDHAHHGTNAHRALTDALAAARAVAAAAEMTDPDDTLILVTADHGHVFNIAGYPRRGNPILGLVHPPAPDLSDDPTPPSPARDGRPYTTLGYYNGPSLRDPDAGPLTQAQVLDPDFRQEAAVPMGSETHSGEDIIAYARGPWAHLVDGVMEQHTLNRIITFAYGWPGNTAPEDAASAE
ncbi:alkaline phosphatase [Maricaulaceae bacterium MS644]